MRDKRTVKTFSFVTQFGQIRLENRPKATCASCFRLLCYLSTNHRNKGFNPMSLLTSISFFDVSMALLFVGIAERLILAYAPLEMVGRDGWLIRCDIEE
jgi:hypothetical protein